jgi:hypothetical protein
MFVVRGGDVMEGNFDTTPWHFAAIKNFEILDQSSSNIIGGQPVSHTVSKKLLEKWTLGTYVEEYLGGGSYRTDENHYANVYLWCFSQSPIDSLTKGRPMGSHKFTGNESLVLNFTDETQPSSWTVDVFAYSESILETAANGLNIISL